MTTYEVVNVIVITFLSAYASLTRMDWRRATKGLDKAVDVCRAYDERNEDLRAELSKANDQINVLEEARALDRHNLMQPDRDRALFNQAQEILRRAPTLQRIRVIASMERPYLDTSGLLTFLNESDAHLAVVATNWDARQPFQVAIKHVDGWRVLRDGTYDLLSDGGDFIFPADYAPSDPLPTPETRSPLGTIRRRMDL